MPPHGQEWIWLFCCLITLENTTPPSKKMCEHLSQELQPLAPCLSTMAVSCKHYMTRMYSSTSEECSCQQQVHFSCAYYGKHHSQVCLKNSITATTKRGQGEKEEEKQVDQCGEGKPTQQWFLVRNIICYELSKLHCSTLPSRVQISKKVII